MSTHYGRDRFAVKAAFEHRLQNCLANVKSFVICRKPPVGGQWGLVDGHQIKPGGLRVVKDISISQQKIADGGFTTHRCHTALDVKNGLRAEENESTAWGLWEREERMN